MHKLRSNNVIMITLRDDRYNKFYESILGIVETNLSQGLVWFHYFLDFIINLRESYEGPILVLNTKFYRYDMKSANISMTIIYIYQYKLHNSTYSRVIKPLGKKGETIYFLINTTKANINIPTIVPWEKIELPKS